MYIERKQSIVLCNMLNNSLVECCVFFVDSFLRYYTSFHDMKILYTGFNIFAPRFSLFYSCKRFRPVLKPLRHIYKQIIFLIKTVNICMKELRLIIGQKGQKRNWTTEYFLAYEIRFFLSVVLSFSLFSWRLSYQTCVDLR